MKCPRAYYLHNVYKDPKTGRKVNITGPALALGISVHEVLEGLIAYKAEDRMKESLYNKLDRAWQKVSGKRGGFKSSEEEEATKERAKAMLARVIANPGPLANKAIKIKEELPNFFISEEDNIILCGKVDWLEYLPESDSVHILDFKTGKNEESEDSLQLPMYHLLVKQCQKRSVGKASYWYLDRDDTPLEKPLPDLEEARARVLAVGRQMKEARAKKLFDCPRGSGGCFACRPYEAILSGEAEFVGVGEFKQDLYMLP